MTAIQPAKRIKESIERLTLDLAQLKGSSSHWAGSLSTSALSTATAVSALSICRDKFLKAPWQVESEITPHGRYSSEAWEVLIENGSKWLANAQNSDGGFGDTDRSLSNIATTLLVLAAWQLAGHNPRYNKQVTAAWKYVERKGSWDGLRQRYGKDKTFVVPIMTNCALAGLVDWGQIPTLPFEAAALPQAWYRFVQLPVVSYAVPALVAIGQAQFHHRTPSNPIVRMLRTASIQPTRNVLTRMQPTSGGYLEAVPLTSFVLMSLASIGQGSSRVATESRKFIVDSVLDDGSWPIDTNLATWVTSLASAQFYVPNPGNPNSENPKLENAVCTQSQWDRTIDWLLACQHVVRHPFTGAEPGGWGWTNLSGAVPDADDTPAALIALKKWLDARAASVEQPAISASTLDQIRLDRVVSAAALGCTWLLKLQNRDGGWPTFCRGWGTLPFDRSGSDLTAHAIRALCVWRETLQSVAAKHRPPSRNKIDLAIERGWDYLEKQQKADGSWLPLWFGNQDREQEDNPIYGTGRVLLGYAQGGRAEHPAFQNGLKYLLANQNADGGWGGGINTRYTNTERIKESVSSTIEETSAALEGIMFGSDTNDASASILRGLEWLCASIEAGHHHISQPIGFYFARLWYHEKLYPLVFSLSALNKGLEFCQR